MRLQKFLSAAGVCSRRKGETYILAGRVRVNGEKVVELGTQVDPDTDHVEVDGRKIEIKETRIYIAMNKPEGVVTSCSHPGEKTVLDMLNLPQRVYPVGRLDKDSTGLLLLTNDGRLHHRLLHPSFDHEKEYDVWVEKPIPDGALAKLEKGVPLMGTRTRPARVRRIAPNRFRIVLKEGKNRQVRRMVRKVGNRVKSLKRMRMANIRLGNLAPGKFRHLTQKETQALLKSAGL